MFGPRIKRRRDGRYLLRLSAAERSLLQNLPSEALDMLEDRSSPSLQRVFPVAYPDDPTAEADYQALVGGELLDRRRHALDTLASTAEAEDLDEEQLQQWLGALETMRLVVGSELDVTEDMDDMPDTDPRAPTFMVYRYLSWLQGDVIEALAAALPEPTGGD